MASVGFVHVLVDAEAGLAEEDASTDALFVAHGVDGVLGEICICWIMVYVAPSLSMPLDQAPQSTLHLVEFHPRCITK